MNQKNNNSFGIPEEVGPVGQLLDDFIYEIEDSEAGKLWEGDEPTAGEVLLVFYGEQYSTMAFSTDTVARNAEKAAGR